MVDVSGKPVTSRTATAEAWVKIAPKTARALRASGGLAKGNVLETARLAGVLAAKRTPELIPLCHPLVIDAIEVEAALVGSLVRIVARVA
jgi:cyclic pyranopterin phosphate synthase